MPKTESREPAEWSKPWLLMRGSFGLKEGYAISSIKQLDFKKKDDKFDPD